ncbi:hypothetical protein HQ393_16210 [Chitinibacter bivalviorum]|uniref:Uncharacterized protein n=1 Tax=Chitinibacter bivalviorum TaxID=2739434 RepID=A0A7H9BLW2_9NEIS|nr:hypothetical protein [Chitinibacter bivalviorum]QLG89667.1 hypothetical protein HQ393_16210 [Chitinibacter bivalviorum]
MARRIFTSSSKELICIITLLAIGLLLHSIGSVHLNQHRSVKTQDDNLTIAMPVEVQLLTSAGDRYLAANINVFRAIMVSYQPDQITVNTQAKLQTEAATFNPAHEDNYYLAAATLSWQNAVPAAQQVLKRAMDHRQFDLYPPFYYGFNLRYFLHDTIGGARYIEEAAKRTNGGNQQALFAIAARWYEKAPDTQEAINIVRAMHKQSRDPALRKYLEQRISRLEGLATLKIAATQFIKLKKKPAKELSDFVNSGLLESIPLDPTGLGYEIDQQGTPILGNAVNKKP